MKQFIVPAGGGLENLRVDDVAEPGAPGPGEIRIRHKAVGLNFIDVSARSRRYSLPSRTRLAASHTGRSRARRMRA